MKEGMDSLDGLFGQPGVEEGELLQDDYSYDYEDTNYSGYQRPSQYVPYGVRMEDGEGLEDMEEEGELEEEQDSYRKRKTSQGDGYNSPDVTMNKL
jgi:hypothetical protein